MGIDIMAKKNARKAKKAYKPAPKARRSTKRATPPPSPNGASGAPSTNGANGESGRPDNDGPMGPAREHAGSPDEHWPNSVRPVVTPLLVACHAATYLDLDREYARERRERPDYLDPTRDAVRFQRVAEAATGHWTELQDALDAAALQLPLIAWELGSRDAQAVPMAK